MYKYDYLIMSYRIKNSQENLNAIGEWFEQYGTEFWNGECYECKELGGRLFPIYKHDENEYTVTGWELL